MARACAPCVPYVFRCFKAVELCADWVTGAAGPVFVVLCWCLIGGGGFIFFDVIYPSTSLFLPLPVHLLLAPLSAWVAANLYGHYHLVCSVSPGRPGDGLGRGSHAEKGLWPWAVRRDGTKGEGPMDDIAEGGRRERKCRKCGSGKPERAHHCRVCKSCILKYDHHCPWINNCVGLRNERHFILFMVYLVLACFLFCTLGYPNFFPSLDSSPWPFYSPRIAYTLEYVLALALGIAVAIMVSWHLLQASWGETTVEGHDNVYYSDRARARGVSFSPRYDLGRRRNLEMFFNVGREGYPYWTLLIPYRVQSFSDGRRWERRRLHAGEAEVEEEEALTDDEEGGGGYVS